MRPGRPTLFGLCSALLSIYLDMFFMYSIYYYLLVKYVSDGDNVIDQSTYMHNYIMGLKACYFNLIFSLNAIHGRLNVFVNSFIIFRAV